MQTKDRARLVMTLGVFACLAWSSKATGQGLVVPTAGSDQQLDGGSLDGRADRLRVELMESRDDQRAQPVGVLARLGPGPPQHPPPDDLAGRYVRIVPDDDSLGDLEEQ